MIIDKNVEINSCKLEIAIDNYYFRKINNRNGKGCCTTDFSVVKYQHYLHTDYDMGIVTSFNDSYEHVDTTGHIGESFLPNVFRTRKMANEKLEVLIAKLVGTIISVVIMIPCVGKVGSLSFFITAVVYGICKIIDVSGNIPYSGYKFYFYSCIAELTCMLIGVALCFAALAFASEQMTLTVCYNYITFAFIIIGSLDDIVRFCSFLYRLHYTKKQLNEYPIYSEESKV